MGRGSHDGGSVDQIRVGGTVRARRDRGSGTYRWNEGSEVDALTSRFGDRWFGTQAGSAHRASRGNDSQESDIRATSFELSRRLAATPSFRLNHLLNILAAAATKDASPQTSLSIATKPKPPTTIDATMIVADL